MSSAVTSQSHPSSAHSAGAWLTWILDIFWASMVSNVTVLLSMLYPNSPVEPGLRHIESKQATSVETFEKLPPTPTSSLPAPIEDSSHFASEQSVILQEAPEPPTEVVVAPLHKPANIRIPTVSFVVPPLKRGSSPAPSRRTSCEQVSFKVKQVVKEHCPLSPDSAGPRKIPSMSFLRPKKLRKMPSAPEALSVTLAAEATPPPTQSPASPSKRPKPQRLRTQPYEAPYFFPQPGTLAAEQYLAPRKRSAPTRVNSAPPSPTTSDIECDPKKPRKAKSGFLSPTRRVST